MPAARQGAMSLMKTMDSGAGTKPDCMTVYVQIYSKNYFWTMMTVDLMFNTLAKKASFLNDDNDSFSVF